MPALRSSSRALRFGSRALRFGSRALRFGSRALHFGPRAQRFGSRALHFGPRAQRFGVVLLLAAWLAGCAAPAPVDSAQRFAAAQAHQRWLEGLTQWHASGRVAVEVPGDGWNATLLWRQDAAGYRIQLGGPFGQGAVRIDGDSTGVRLRTADGRQASAPTAESLLEQELGTQVPITVLRYWLTGRPAPQHPVTHSVLDDAGRLLELDQAGWQVRYAEYARSDGGALPARLAIQREQTEARFLISRWQVGS